MTNIDLATYDELETYMYGGSDATTYFVRGTKKSTWFTMVPVPLQSPTQPTFNQTWQAKVTRGGDYLLHSWLRTVFPQITLNQGAGSTFGAAGAIRWCANPMHNLVKECTISFNDIVKAKFTSFFLDFWAAFTVPAGKRIGYDNMIGNVSQLTNPLAINGNPGTVLPARALNLPLPLPHTRDTGVALPTAAIPYNEMYINFTFRDWSEMLIVDSVLTSGGTGRSAPAVAGDISGSTPTLTQTACWGNYAIVSNHERKKMGKHVRDILIEQQQENPPTAFNPATDPNHQYPVHFSHAVKCLFFAARNKTNRNEWSNYTAASPIQSGTGLGAVPGPGLVYDTTTAVDPITNFTLLYENTPRLQNVPIDYFSLVNPFYHAVSIPVETGYHMYSYSLYFPAHNPMGSTNYGKLTGVQLAPAASAGAIVGANGTGAANTGADYAQTFDFIAEVINNNVLRVAGKQALPATVDCQDGCKKLPSWENSVNSYSYSRPITENKTYNLLVNICA